MFASLKKVLQTISASKLQNKDSNDTTWWIKRILELFSEIHQIDHNVNKLFMWLLSECQSLYEDGVNDGNSHTLQTYLHALFASIQLAMDRKQDELQGLEILLKDICLSIITTATTNPLHPIAMSIIQYLCRHTDNVWSVCCEFTLFQFNQHCTVSHTSDEQHLLHFDLLCQFVLMLLQCPHQTNMQWLSNILSISCKLIHNHNYLRILCKTLYFNLYTQQHDTFALSKHIVQSIDDDATLSMEHFLLLQWIAPILFTDEFHNEAEAMDIATQYRKCILYGLRTEIKTMQQIAIQLVQQHHSFILSPTRLSNECVHSLCTLYSVMYEVRASTISNLLTLHLNKLLSLLSETEHAADVMDWIHSVLHVIWTKGLKHRNKAVRRVVMYGLLSWDFDKHSAPFSQSFVLNDLLLLLNHPLWFRRSHYDIAKNQGLDKHSARPKSNWQSVSSKSEEALSSKSPPEGFGFLIELFLKNYLFKCIHQPFAQQVFLSEFIQSVCDKITSYYSLYHTFGFLAAIHQHQDYDSDTPLLVIHAQNIQSLQTLLCNSPKFGPLYNKKLMPFICEFMSIHLDPNTPFYSVCKLMDAIPKTHVSPALGNQGFVHLQKNLNKQDWIGTQLLRLIKQYMNEQSDGNAIKVDVIQNVLQYVACGDSFHSIMDVLFDVASVSYSQPYKSERIVKFCMQLLSFVIDWTEHYPHFTKPLTLVRQRMVNPITEIVSYIFEQQWMHLDFSQPKHWMLKMARNLIQYYGHLSTVRAWITAKLNTILPIWYSRCNQQPYSVQEFPLLYLISICLKYHHQWNDTESMDHVLLLWISIRVNRNVNKTHCETLQFIQFNAILGILTQPNPSISKETARSVIQFAVHTVDNTQTQIRASILECISLLLPFAKLSPSNLNVLSTSAWYVLSDTNAQTSIPDSYCIDLLLFPTLFDDKQLHVSPDGAIRKQLEKAFESKKSSVLQPMLSYAFLLWFKYPDIATLYIDPIVAMTHTVYNTKVFDPEDRIHREEYLFAALLMFLSVMFQQTTKTYFTFKSVFVTKLFEMIDKECEFPYLDVIHQKTWNIFWHLSQFITQQNGFEDHDIHKILTFLCDLCYDMDREISSNQRQWITLSIVRIIVQTPKYIECLYKRYQIVGRKPNTHVWLMYALGDTAHKLVIKYQSHDTISKHFLLNTLQRILGILTPYLTNNYGLVRTTSQYFFYALMKHYISLDPDHTFEVGVMAIYKDLSETPDSIKLRKRLKTCYEWLEQSNQKISNEQKDNDLSISRNKAFKENEMLQDRIIQTIVTQHPNNNEVIVNEIVHLIKNRVGLVSFTEQLSDALSSVLLSSFEYYAGSKAKEKEKENKELIGYQRKLDPLRMEYNKCIQMEQLRLQQEIKANRRKSFGDVIVVTSLLEKATNLGGISRTCEIFGVKKMIVHDTRVIKRDDFKRLSVTSEQWLPIEQVARKDLISYLRKQKESNGYVIIGLEQTTNSIGLNEVEFIGQNAKCIIVIGTEKTGLPPDVINECDICVEIPQFGVVRSLNAHVSFAITLWEYVKQQLVTK